ncbi:MAG: glycosyltransferase family 39 protein [Rhodospirillales bacterium]|nr:glycosyltransferase family 39 protein [Rhodospirillales bacterium]
MTVPKGEALKQALFVPAIFLLLYMTAVVFRPLIPIDETRYITVAWEMYLRHDWLAPLTVNFQPYHHKPPLLFWLMNGAWGALGVSRWAATIPVVLSAMISVYLTRALAGRILPEGQDRVMLVMLGSLPFLLYATLILFDLTMTVFVLAALLCLYGFAQNRRIGAVLLMGLFLGLGVLTKGPVAYLYVIFPVLLGPYWAKGSGSWLGWYMGFIGAVLVSVIPIMVWLVPVLKSSSGDFAYWLLWGTNRRPGQRFLWRGAYAACLFLPASNSGDADAVDIPAGFLARDTAEKKKCSPVITGLISAELAGADLYRLFVDWWKTAALPRAVITRDHDAARIFFERPAAGRTGENRAGYDGCVCYRSYDRRANGL